MAERKDRMALLSRYDKHYLFRYETKPVYNKWAEQWAADAIIDSYGIHDCYELLDYYFGTAEKPDWKYFSNFIDTIERAKKMKEQDDKERAERRKKAKEWLNG